MADTLNLYKDHGPGEPPHGGMGRLVGLVLLAIVIVGVLGYFFIAKPGEELEKKPEVVDAGAPPPPKPMLPSPSESDPRVRSLLQGASADELWATWLKQSDLVRVFV